uniref:Uncharacterized protein n=1 Tax=Anguilla anguilla TaxID=7936 RepID=A0A0E9X5M4_ANGAN
MGDFLITDRAMPEILTMAIDTVLSRQLFHSIDCKKRQYPLHIHKHIEFIVAIHFFKKHFGKEKKRKKPFLSFLVRIVSHQIFSNFFLSLLWYSNSHRKHKSTVGNKIPFKKNFTLSLLNSLNKNATFQ